MENFKLKKFFFIKRIKYKDVANALGISESSFSRKINELNAFNALEIAKMCSIYNLDANDFFFKDMLLKR